MSIDLFQHLTFNHDKTVGKLIVLQDIKHQTPLILSERDACCILIGRVLGCPGCFSYLVTHQVPSFSIYPLPGVGAEGGPLPHYVLPLFPSVAEDGGGAGGVNLSPAPTPTWAPPPQEAGDR